MEFAAEVVKLSKLRYSSLKFALLIEQDGMEGKRYTHVYSKEQADFGSFLINFIQNMNISTAVTMKDNEITMTFGSNPVQVAQQRPIFIHQADRRHSVPIPPPARMHDFMSTQLVLRASEGDMARRNPQHEPRMQDGLGQTGETKICPTCGTVCLQGRRMYQTPSKTCTEIQTYYFCPKCDGRDKNKGEQEKLRADSTNFTNLLHPNHHPSRPNQGAPSAWQPPAKQARPLNLLHVLQGMNMGNQEQKRAGASVALAADKTPAVKKRRKVVNRSLQYIPISQRPICYLCGYKSNIIYCSYYVDKETQKLKEYYRWKCMAFSCRKTLGISSKDDYDKWKQNEPNPRNPGPSKKRRQALDRYYSIEEKPLCYACGSTSTMNREAQPRKGDEEIQKVLYRWRCSYAGCRKRLGSSNEADHEKWVEMGFGMKGPGFRQLQKKCIADSYKTEQPATTTPESDKTALDLTSKDVHTTTKASVNIDQRPVFSRLPMALPRRNFIPTPAPYHCPVPLPYPTPTPTPYPCPLPLPPPPARPYPSPLPTCCNDMCPSKGVVGVKQYSDNGMSTVWLCPTCWKTIPTVQNQDTRNENESGQEGCVSGILHELQQKHF